MAGPKSAAVICTLATMLVNLASARELLQTSSTVPTNASYGNTLQTALMGNASAIGERPAPIATSGGLMACFHRGSGTLHYVLRLSGS